MTNPCRAISQFALDTECLFCVCKLLDFLILSIFAFFHNIYIFQMSRVISRSTPGGTCIVSKDDFLKSFEEVPKMVSFVLAYGLVLLICFSGNLVALRLQGKVGPDN